MGLGCFSKYIISDMGLLWFELAFVYQLLILTQRKGFLCLVWFFGVYSFVFLWVYLFFFGCHLISCMACFQELNLSREMNFWIANIS